MRIYLDHNATSPPLPAVRELLVKNLCMEQEAYGNPSSPHARGARARAALETARDHVAEFLGVAASGIVFTSGATEANNMAIFGAAQAWAAAHPGVAAHFVTTQAEHPSILAPLARLEAQGAQVTRIGVDCDGRIDPTQLEASLHDGTGLVSLLWANNETGVVQDLREIASIVKARGILLHLDAVQAAGKLDLALDRLPWDLISFSGHKLGGPMGIGCLVMRAGVALAPFLVGGTQERRRRAGTENLLGALGFGAACARLREAQKAEQKKWTELRERLWQGIRAKLPDAQRNGRPEQTLCNTLSVTFPGVDGAVLVEALDLEGICVSSGSACASGSSDPSHVLLAMGRSPAAARATLRLSLGPGVDAAQIERVTQVLPQLVMRIRSLVSNG